MWEKIRIIFTIPELRKKIFFTLALLAVYRVGFQIPLPIVDVQRMAANSNSGSLSDIFNTVAMFSATRLNVITIFGLGIMPYISASIILQLLGSVWGPLEKLRKEGESGQKKINEYTRYLTVLICIFQSWGWVAATLFPSGAPPMVNANFLNANGGVPFGWIFVTVVTMTAGTVFLMWIGEQIDEFGIGNGISLLIMANILAGMPGAVLGLLNETNIQLGDNGIDRLLVLVLLFFGVVAGVVYITQAQRQIPTQSAKHVRGRRVFGGGARQYLPLRVNQSGVMPIIFASSLLLFPMIGFKLLADRAGAWSGWGELQQTFQRGQSYTYSVFYIILIYFFCYFWTAITFNPKEMADNLKDHGTFIPGYRPGRRTADHLERVMVRITYVGAGFLAVVAIIPTIVSGLLDVHYPLAGFFGGTGLLIVVSVAFDLVQKIDSHLVMRNYKGLLE